MALLGESELNSIYFQLLLNLNDSSAAQLPVNYQHDVKVWNAIKILKATFRFMWIEKQDA